MELWLHVLGKDYPINLGAPLTDAMGEELDSMNVSVSHVAKINGMKPFDDAYVHNVAPNEDGTSNFVGRECGRIHVPSAGEWYRHFLVFMFDRREVNQTEGLFNYSITLISETKYLEKIAMPNRTITVPLDGNGKSVYEMAKIFVERYSPRIKVTDGTSGRWHYEPRFRISDSENVMGDDLIEAASCDLMVVQDAFSMVVAPESSFNNPNLREALTRLFSVKGCIPVVRDGIIFARKLSEKKRKIETIKGKIWDAAMMSGDEYCDRLRKNYSSGLTDKNGVVYHEYVGFRNMNSPTMRFSDLCIEVRNPIYKINRFAMCYYSKKKKGKVVKIDLTNFVVPDTTRAFLSNDYLTFSAHPPKSVNGRMNIHGQYELGLCDYKFMTVQYGIGSTSITGFGDIVKYTTDGITYKTRTVLDNVISLAVAELVGTQGFEQGIEESENGTTGTYHDEAEEYSVTDIMAKTPPSTWQGFFATVSTKLFGGDSGTEGVVSNDSLRIKSVFFEIEYQGMVTAAVTVSKDLHDGDVVAIDAQHDSLAVTETDGTLSKFKVNRLGNETCNVTARVLDFSDLVGIGDYDDEHGICYKRTVAIERDFISASYTFAKDHILANYFTGVFSKYRSTAYASYSQSVRREENHTLQLLLSKDRMLRSPSSGIMTHDFEAFDFVDVFSAGKGENDVMALFSVRAPIPGESAYREYSDDQTDVQFYSVDRARFMSGNSLCYSFGMSDSETAGTYITQLFPDVTDATAAALNVTQRMDEMGIGPYAFYANLDSPINDITGSAQGYLSLPRSRNDGSLSDMRFYLSFSDGGILDKAYKADEEHTEDWVRNLYDSDLLKLPLMRNSSQAVYRAVGSSAAKKAIIRETYKDAKEIIGETFQVEPITDDGIMVSPYFLKLSNVFGTKRRIYDDKHGERDSYPVFVYTNQYVKSVQDEELMVYVRLLHSMAFYTSKGDVDGKELKEIVDGNGGLDVESLATFSMPYESWDGSERFGVVTSSVKRITEVAEDHIKVVMSLKTEYDEQNLSNVNLPKEWRARKVWIEDFETTWWDSEYLKEHGDELFPGTLYHYLFDVGYGQQEPLVPSRNGFFEPVANRKCYVFNFCEFPVGQDINVVWKDGTRGTVRIQSAEGQVSKGDNWVNYAIQRGKIGTYDIRGFSNVTDVSGEEGPSKAKFVSLAPIVGDLVERRNMFWFVNQGTVSESVDPMASYGSISELGELGFVICGDPAFVEEYGKISVRVRSHGKSAALFYLDSDSKYHFVFGFDFDRWDDSLSLSFATFYASLVPDRSRTVYGPDMEPTYETHNYADGLDGNDVCDPK